MPSSEAHRPRKRRGNKREPRGQSASKSSSDKVSERKPITESGGEFSQSTFERHAKLLSDSRLSQRMYSRQRAEIVQQLQRDYGNHYVQRLVERVQRMSDDAVREPSQAGTISDGVGDVARLTIQRMSEELKGRADSMLEAVKSSPGTVDIEKLKSLHAELNKEYTDKDDYDAGAKAYSLKQTVADNIVEIIKPLVKPLLTTIKNQLTSKLKDAAPEWIAKLPDVDVVAGEGISGGLAVGLDSIFITPETGAELLFEGALAFSISHEVGHLVSGNLAYDMWTDILETDEAIKESGVEVKGQEKDKPKKYEEIRADIFGAEMLAAHLGKQPEELEEGQIKAGIDAPADAEHPSFDERVTMLSKFLGIECDKKH